MNILITVQGIIVASLLVWAGFWTHAYDIYTSYESPDIVWHVSLILGTIYVAALFSVLGIIFAIFNPGCKHKRLHTLTLTFWGYSWTCMVVLILISIVPLFVKAWHGYSQWRALIPDWNWLSPHIATYIFIGGSLATIALWQFFLSKILQSKLQ